MNDNVTATKSYTFYGTFINGQPNYPGYFEVTVEDAASYIHAFSAAYQRMCEATGETGEVTTRQWCCLYDSLDSMPPNDRIFRGKA